ADLADYFRLEHAKVKRPLAELPDEQLLREVRVERWKERAYVPRGMKVPGELTATALLSPFDSLVWFRPRNERLFNFHYRIEIYTPEPKRTYGYYVLPFMVNGNIVGRVDLKADRATGTLMVPGAFAEPGVNLTKTASLLRTELQRMATWLDLSSIEVGRKGNLAGQLTKALSARRR
ncbi:MAG: DNA glycosylase AlkZ-like family protein, partial [Ilumatobacteraceae bacterium]